MLKKKMVIINILLIIRHYYTVLMSSSDITEQASVAVALKTYIRQVQVRLSPRIPAILPIVASLGNCWSGTFNYRMTASTQISSF
jgi:hypothetical protein